MPVAQMEERLTDILVIGGGLAGILSALEAERSGLNVLMVGKIGIGRGTNSSLSNGVFTAANSGFSGDDHLRMTFESGKGLNRPFLVRQLVEQAPDSIRDLSALGAPLVERGTAYSVLRPEGSSQLPGILLVKALTDRLAKSTIQLLPGMVIFDLVVEGGEVRGGFGFLRDGRPCLVHSKAVVLGTGGGGGIYRRSDNQKRTLGDGYALALRAGLSLFDLEFIQFFPLALAEPRLSTFYIPPPYPKGMRLFDHKGTDLLERIGLEGGLNRAVLTERDRLSIALFEASQTGDIYCDLTAVAGEKWNEYPLNFLKKSRFPFHERPFLIAPVVHFFMGGVETDREGRTSLPGLFAAGEVSWGIHGANRLGGNALTECAVFGPIAGRSAGNDARMKEDKEGESSRREALKKRWERKAKRYERKKRRTFESPREILGRLKELAWRYGGIVRDEGSLKEGLGSLVSIEEKIDEIYPLRTGDLFRKRELENMVLLLKAILKGSLLRRESRGSFFRKDFPDQDERNWKKNTCYRLEKGELRITHLDKCEM